MMDSVSGKGLFGTGLTLKQMMADPIIVCLLIMVASCGALAFALTMEYVFGLEPCILCLYQRWPYLITAFLGLVGLSVGLKDLPKASALMAFLCAPVYAMGAVIAVYHSGVERKAWKSFLEGCAVNFGNMGEMSPEDLLASIEKAPTVRCDEIPWEFLGLSMANWNVPLSLALAAFALISSILIARRANGVL